MDCIAPYTHTTTAGARRGWQLKARQLLLPSPPLHNRILGRPHDLPDVVAARLPGPAPCRRGPGRQGETADRRRTGVAPAASAGGGQGGRGGGPGRGPPAVAGGPAPGPHLSPAARDRRVPF